MVLHISTPTHLVSAFPQHFLVTVTHIAVTEPLSVMVASAAGDFDWVSKVNVGDGQPGKFVGGVCVSKSERAVDIDSVVTAASVRKSG